jgi:hypothetical protein
MICGDMHATVKLPQSLPWGDFYEIPTDCPGLRHRLARRRDPARMRSMAKPPTVDDILPLVASLTPQERARLLRLIAMPQGADASVYRSVPPSREEFSADDEPLARDADGWEDVG